MIVADVFPVPSAVAVRIDFCAFVNIDLLRGYTGGMNELHLLGFPVAQSGGALESVQMIFIKRLFGNRGSADRIGCHRSLHGVGASLVLLNLADVTGHQLDASV